MVKLELCLHVLSKQSECTTKLQNGSVSKWKRVHDEVSVREYLVVHVFSVGLCVFHLFHAAVPLAACSLDDRPMVGNSLLPSLHVNFAILRVANATLVER